MHDINVIGTLQMLAACERSETIRAIVIRGSAGIYGSEPQAPQFFREELARLFPLRTRFQRDVGEIENLFETYARRHPDVVCTMLRYQPAVGPALDTQVTRYLRPPVAPTYLGFDPRIQVVHEEDGLGALLAAVRSPVRGAVNVASPGTIGLTRMIRMAGRAPLPLAGAAVRQRHRRADPRWAALAVARLPAPAALRPRGGHHAAGRGGGLHAHATPPRPRWRSSPMPPEREGTTAEAIAAATTFLKALREGLDQGLELPEAVVRSTGVLPGRREEGAEPAGRPLHRGRVGLRRGLRPARSSRSSTSSTTSGGASRPPGWRRSGARARAAGRQPRRHPALGRDDDVDRAPARAPAAALPALPGAGLGLPAALGLDRHPQGRRRGGLALQRAPAAGGRPARGRVPRGGQGHRQALLRALPAPALRPRRVRRAGPAHRRARSCRWPWWAARRSTRCWASPAWPRASCARPTSR